MANDIFRKVEKIVSDVNKSIDTNLEAKQLETIVRRLEHHQTKLREGGNPEQLKPVEQLVKRAIKELGLTACALRCRLRVLNLPASLRRQIKNGTLTVYKAKKINANIKQRTPPEELAKLKDKAVKVMYSLHKKLPLKYDTMIMKGSRPFTANQIARLMEVATPKMALVFFTMALTGARRAEVADLRRSNIDWNEGYIWVGEGYSTAKNNKVGRLFLPPEATPILEKWNDTLDGTDFLFFNNQFKEIGITPNGLGQEFKKCRDKANLDRKREVIKDGKKYNTKYEFSTHGFRKFYCSYIINTLGEGRLGEAKELLRHSKIETTIRSYAAYSITTKQQAVAEIFNTKSKTVKATETDNGYSEIVEQPLTADYKQVDIKQVLDLKLINGDITTAEYNKRLEAWQATNKTNVNHNYIG